MTSWRSPPAIRAPTPLTELADFAGELPGILSRPGPVFVWLKVYPEVENEPIGSRRRWQTRSRDQVLADLRGALGVPAP